MTKPTVGYGALQGLGDGILAANLTEGGCSVAAIDCKLFCHRPSLTLTLPARRHLSAAGRAARCARRDPLSAASFRT